MASDTIRGKKAKAPPISSLADSSEKFNPILQALKHVLDMIS